MKSAILDKGEKYYTYMDKIFHAIGNEQTKYNWLITDCVCYPRNKEFDELFSQEYIWISGDHLTEIIHKEDFQFIWGVFSGFFKDITIEEILKYNLPFSDGNKEFWHDNVKIQHPLANIEIVAWDSSLTLFISQDDELVHRFRHSFPLSEDLAAQNKRNNSQIAHIEELLISNLEKRNIAINERILHQKYLIWSKLYFGKNMVIKDEDVLNCITETLR